MKIFHKVYGTSRKKNLVFEDGEITASTINKIKNIRFGSSLRFHHNKVPKVHEKHDDTSPGCKLIWFQDKGNGGF